MRGIPAIATFALLAIASAAPGAETRFQVSVHVLPSHPAPEAVTALPVPTDARPLGAFRTGHGYHFAGSPDAAMQFYRARMPALGFRLLAERPEGGLLWEGRGTRIDMRFEEVLGDPAATRILITAARARDAG